MHLIIFQLKLLTRQFWIMMQKINAFRLKTVGFFHIHVEDAVSGQSIIIASVPWRGNESPVGELALHNRPSPRSLKWNPVRHQVNVATALNKQTMKHTDVHSGPSWSRTFTGSKHVFFPLQWHEAIWVLAHIYRRGERETHRWADLVSTNIRQLLINHCALLYRAMLPPICASAFVNHTSRHKPHI